MLQPRFHNQLYQSWSLPLEKREDSLGCAIAVAKSCAASSEDAVYDAAFAPCFDGSGDLELVIWDDDWLDAYVSAVVL